MNNSLNYIRHAPPDGSDASTRTVTGPIIDPHAIARVLVARPNHRLGNLLLLTPLLVELERLLPGAEIDVFAGPDMAAELLDGFHSVNRIMGLSARPVLQPGRLLGYWRDLPRRHYDLAIDAELRSHSSRLAVARSQAGWRIGFAGSDNDAHLTHTVFTPAGVQHEARLPVYLLRQALRQSDELPMSPLTLHLGEFERSLGQSRLTDLLGPADFSAPRIGLFAEATGAKRLSAEWWDACLSLLQQRIPRGRLLEIVPAHGRRLLPSPLSAVYCSPLRRLAALLSGLDLVIAADSGLMHLARASGVATLGLFRSTDPQRYGPYGGRSCAIDVRREDALAVALQAASMLDLK